MIYARSECSVGYALEPQKLAPRPNLFGCRALGKLEKTPSPIFRQDERSLSRLRHFGNKTRVPFWTCTCVSRIRPPNTRAFLFEHIRERFTHVSRRLESVARIDCVVNHMPQVSLASFIRVHRRDPTERPNLFARYAPPRLPVRISVLPQIRGYSHPAAR